MNRRILIAAGLAAPFARAHAPAFAARGWQLDWITPAGDHAALAAAALPEAADRLQRAGTAQPLVVGILFLLTAMIVIGLPPLSGFLGKAMLLQASLGYPVE